MISGDNYYFKSLGMSVQDDVSLVGFHRLIMYNFSKVKFLKRYTLNDVGLTVVIVDIENRYLRLLANSFVGSSPYY